jgi:hypothetical protein
MLALLAFEHVCGLQVVGARQSGGTDHSLSVPVDEAWLSRSLAGVVGHRRSIAQIAAVDQRAMGEYNPSRLANGLGLVSETDWTQYLVHSRARCERSPAMWWSTCSITWSTPSTLHGQHSISRR